MADSLARVRSLFVWLMAHTHSTQLPLCAEMDVNWNNLMLCAVKASSPSSTSAIYLVIKALKKANEMGNKGYTHILLSTNRENIRYETHISQNGWDFPVKTWKIMENIKISKLTTK